MQQHRGLNFLSRSCASLGPRDKRVVCTEGTQGSPALLGPCLNLVTWAGL